MAATLDVTNAVLNALSSATTAYSNNFSLVTASGDTGLLVYLLFEGNPGAITAPTWSGNSMTAVGSLQSNTAAGSSVYMIAYGMVSPTIVTHPTFAVSWTNSVVFNYAFLPINGAATVSVASTFIDLVSASGLTILTGGSVTISDTSGSPSSNLNIAMAGCAGGSLALSTGQTDIGAQGSLNDNWDVGYHPSASSDTYTFTGSLGRIWVVQGLTILGVGGSGGSPVITGFLTLTGVGT